ncbi:hypothetical protein J6590_010454 [Homalodisca vitripennis]|nr:hypothetical protein J6590_010454 [Homalodisca vitripennis]
MVTRDLEFLGVAELREIRDTLQADVKRLGGRLAKQLVQRDCYQAKRDWHCDWITAYLQANSEKRSEYIYIYISQFIRGSILMLSQQ